MVVVVVRRKRWQRREDMSKRGKKGARGTRTEKQRGEVFDEEGREREKEVRLQSGWAIKVSKGLFCMRRAGVQPGRAMPCRDMT